MKPIRHALSDFTVVRFRARGGGMKRAVRWALRSVGLAGAVPRGALSSWAVVGAFGAAVLAGCGADHRGATSPENAPGAVSVPDELKDLRTSLARYHDIENALADGYQLGYHGLVTGCVQKPGEGAMGYHYFNWAKMDDPAIVESDPEVLVYHSSEDGTLVLGAVEWVVPVSSWEAAGNAAAPVVFGQTLHVINPVLNWYVQHAWLFDDNPAGVWADWNPDVSCP
jgi:hypothetical protein